MMNIHFISSNNLISDEKLNIIYDYLNSPNEKIHFSKGTQVYAPRLIFYSDYPVYYNTKILSEIIFDFKRKLIVFYMDDDIEFEALYMSNKQSATLQEYIKLMDI